MFEIIIGLVFFILYISPPVFYRPEEYIRYVVVDWRIADNDKLLIKSTLLMIFAWPYYYWHWYKDSK